MNFPEKASFLPYRPAAWLHLSGSDAPAYLQGQFSNDLAKGGETGAVYGLWLDRKGRVQADSFVLRRAGEYWLGSYASPGEGIRRHLESTIVADDVAVEDATALWAGVSLIGEGTGAWLAASARAGMIFPGRRDRGENWEWVFPAAEMAAVRAALPADREEGPEAAERRRIAAVIPSVPADIGPADLPQEAGLETEAVSHDKGCYLGQEVMARLKSRGRVRRGLRRVTGPGAPPALPATLWQEGRKIGELRSAAAGEPAGGFSGLAMLSLLQLRADAPLAQSPEGPPSLRLS